jgi:hypothetical protein
MMYWVGLLGAAVQSPAPTMGDTVWLSRTIGLPTGYVVRAADWEPADPVEVLGRARIVITGDSAKISYPVAIWSTGQQVIDVPGPLLLGPGGTVDSLASERVRLQVKSVLPPLPRDSVLPPQPRAALVSRRQVSPMPLLVLCSLAVVLLIPLHLWWNRRGKPMPPPAAVAELPEPPLHRWAEAGEYRAVANVAALRLRAAVAQRVSAAHTGLDTERLLAELAAVRPDWPLAELGTMLRSLDDARFGQSGAPDALELSQSTLQLRDRLLREAA